jgi:SAM-dependent methyltransferase
MPPPSDSERRRAGKTPRRQRPNHPRPPRAAAAPATESWDAVAGWYDSHLDDPDSHHARVLGPGVDALIGDLPTGRALELGCGEGFFARRLDRAGWRTTAIDISPAMIEAARRDGAATIDWRVDDACTLDGLPADLRFDLILSVMHLTNVRAADEVIETAASRLTPGGVFVGVILHPAFRIPRHSHWLWDGERGVQARRLDGYLQLREIAIDMHPGQRHAPKTLTFHRPLSWYVNALGASGLAVERLGEWCSHRQSTSGPRAAAENRARDEFPLFLAWRARK